MNKQLTCSECGSIAEKEPIIDMYVCNNCGLAFFLNKKGNKTSILAKEPEDEQIELNLGDNNDQLD